MLALGCSGLMGWRKQGRLLGILGPWAGQEGAWLFGALRQDGQGARALVTGRALPVASGGRTFRGARSFNNYPKNNYFRHLIRVKHLDYSG